MSMGCGTSTLCCPASPRIDPKPDAIALRKQACQHSIELNGGRLFVFGILQRANVRNRNGRVYPKSILKREAARYYKTHVKLNRALGELDHPNPTSKTFRQLCTDSVSHRVLDFYWDGEDLVGYVEVLSTPAGSMLRDLYLAGRRLGMSSRGWATLKQENGGVYIQDDFELITFDFVLDPSTEGAYLLPVQEAMNVPLTLPLHVLASEVHLVPPEKTLSSGTPPLAAWQKRTSGPAHAAVYSSPQHGIRSSDKALAAAPSVVSVPVGCRAVCMCGLHDQPVLATPQNSLNLAWQSQFGSPGAVSTPRRG